MFGKFKLKCINLNIVSNDPYSRYLLEILHIISTQCENKKCIVSTSGNEKKFFFILYFHSIPASRGSRAPLSRGEDGMKVASRGKLYFLNQSGL